MNSLFDKLGKSPSTQIPRNPMQMMKQFQQNPIGILQSVGYNIPDGMSNPQQIVQHLMQSGQLPNSKLQQAQQMLSQFMK